MRIMSVLLLALITSTADGAGSDPAREPISVFGIQMQAPLAIPECPISDFYRRHGGSMKYDRPKEGACYERFVEPRRSATPPMEETITIKWPLLEGPEMAKTGQLTARLVQGRVERVWFTTRGAASQPADLLALSQRFGEPDSFQETPVQNAFGASFVAVSALWKKGDLTIQFSGIDGRVDTGSVIFASPLGEASMRAALGRGTRPEL